MSSKAVKAPSSSSRTSIYNNNNTGTMNANAAPTNIWQMMNYPVPRGKCVYKPSVLSSSCPCLRFMLNPLQAASSFTCDGCGHHASFHTLKNEEEADEGFQPEMMANGNNNNRGKKRPAARITNGAGATGRRGVGLLGGVGLMGVGSSADDDDDIQVLEGEKLQVVKRSRA